MAEKGRPSPRIQGRKGAGDRQPSASARRAERARVALYEATDGRALARAVFRLMLATVPGHFASANFHCSPLPGFGAWLSSNGRKMSPRLMDEISKVQLGVPELLAVPGRKVLPTRGVLPPEKELVQTPFYRLFMRPYHWRHSVGLFFWKSISPLVLDCVFCIFRPPGQNDFSDEEIARLGALHPEIDRARRRVARLAEGRGALSSLQHLVRDLPVPAVLLNWPLEPLYHNREGVEYCARWRQGAAARALKPRYDLPPALLAECGAMKEQWIAGRGRRGNHPRSTQRTVHHPAAQGLRARISMLPVEAELVSDPNFLIVFEHSSTREAVTLTAPHPELAEFSRLTPRQREIATLAGEGNSNGEIATALGCSLGNVKNGLHAIFKKLEVASRAQLMRKFVAG